MDLIKGLQNIMTIDERVIKAIAVKHISLFKTRVTKHGKDYQGDNFPGYSDQYAGLKAGDFRDEEGKRYEGYGNVSLSTQIDPPNFQLTYKTMRDLKVLEFKKTYYTIGWNNERAVQIVEGNAKRKRRPRNIMDGIPEDELNKIRELYEKEYQKNIDRIVDKTIIKI